MVTKLQRVVDLVEDRHIGEPIGKGTRRDKWRGSVLNATPKELNIIRKIAVPMDETDHGSRRHHKKHNIAGWKKWLDHAG